MARCIFCVFLKYCGPGAGQAAEYAKNLRENKKNKRSGPLVSPPHPTDTLRSLLFLFFLLFSKDFCISSCLACWSGPTMARAASGGDQQPRQLSCLACWSGPTMTRAALGGDQQALQMVGTIHTCMYTHVYLCVYIIYIYIYIYISDIDP